ncbi:MAG: TetR/AcrR family transcriptional regulator [Burkholderiales bacterium]|nr:TetR/AcrR family transcriptional regulator [Burkholderiales bacterium]
MTLTPTLRSARPRTTAASARVGAPGRRPARVAAPVPAATDVAGRGPAARMRRLLLDTASALIRTQGAVPSVSDVAAAAGVSRATAYRYFPTRSKLIAGVVDHSLGEVRRRPPLADAPVDAQGADRLRRLFESTFGRFQEYEPQMRAALQLSLEHAALDRAGLLKEERYRRGYRVGLLKDALSPLRGQLTRRNHELLWKALSIVYGIEPYVILKDIWGARDAEVEAVARWMVEALTQHALREAPGAGRRRTDGSPDRDDGDGSGAIELR